MRSAVALLAALCAALPLWSGCAALAPTATEARADSLQAVAAALEDANDALRDSLALRDDIDSGQYDRERRALQDQLMRLSYELSALRDGGQTLSVVQADALFQSASAALTDGGRERLASVAAQLRNAYPQRLVRVEGHSDDVPIRGALQEQYPSNWELSTARAAAVVRALIDLSGLNADQFVAVGYSDTRPVASNDTASGRRRNRRVRIAVMPAPRDYTRPFETSW